MLIAFSFIVVAVVIYALIKQYETRMVLFMAGLVMCIAALQPIAAFKGFSSALKSSAVLEIITSSMAFAFVMDYTKCDKHLVHLLSKGLKKLGPKLLIPGSVLVTAFVHISIPSAGGCVASVGTVLIPILIGSGVHPVMAASAIMSGTFGATMLHPGFHQNVVVSQATKVPPLEIAANHFNIVLILGVIVAIGVTITAYMRKEATGWQQEVEDANFKVDVLKALVPLVPLTLILLGSLKIVPALKVLEISYAMIIGVIVCCIVTRTSPGEISNAFFKGLGHGFSHVYGIIIASAVFVAGLTTSGLLKEMLTIMNSNPAFAKVAGAFGPFLLALVVGSGDAASVAFNNAVTPHAAALGINALDLGGVAAIAGCLGRTMSPIAAVAMISCGLAGVKNPMELAKRNGPVMIVANFVLLAWFFIRA